MPEIAAKGTISHNEKSRGMDIESRIQLLAKLGDYFSENGSEWQAAKAKAINANGWFTLSSIDFASGQIVAAYLQEGILRRWLQRYDQPEKTVEVGVVAAGNIPLTGFHDFLCCFASGQRLRLKLSHKDSVLLTHLIEKMTEWNPEFAGMVRVDEMLKGCDAYIATGSNNTARYFQEYFGKYKHIIRRNRTSVAVLSGHETEADFTMLGEDIFTYFGLGCRNVTQLCVPEGYDFNPLVLALTSYSGLMDHNKYRNNYDFHLALFLMNKVAHFDNGSLLLVENALPFSAVSVLHYRQYQDSDKLLAELRASNDIQTIVGAGGVALGTAQQPAIDDYADGIDTMQFLCSL